MRKIRRWRARVGTFAIRVAFEIVGVVAAIGKVVERFNRRRAP